MSDEQQATSGEPFIPAGFEHMAPRGETAATTPELLKASYQPVAAAERAAAAKAPAPEAPAAEEPGLAYKDDHDLTEEERAAQAAAAEPESFEKYRFAKGHAISVPEALARDTRFEEVEIQSVARDAGIALSQAGVTAEAANAIFEIVSVGYQPPTDESGFDLDRGLSEVRSIAGEQTDALIEKVQRFVKERPALAAYLDETTLGNHPKVLLAISAIASRPSLQTKAGAQAYLAELRNPATEVSKRYFGGDKFEVFTAQIAFGVAYGKEPRFPGFAK
jgi:hypothetical protein